MTISTTRFLLLVLVCLCRLVSYGQANLSESRTANPNFTSFTSRVTTNKEAWKKFNNPADYNHPEFGTLPQDAPCTECVEILEKRKADERQFRDIKDPSEIYTQKAYGDINYQKNGQWISVEDKLKKIAPGVFQSDFYIQPSGIDANAHKSYIVTPQGKVYFNQWSLYAKNAQGETLLAKANWSDYTAGDDGVYIKNIFKGIDAELKVYRGTIKTSFIMKKNEFGIFDQLIFRDEYTTSGRTSIAFAEDGNIKHGVGKLNVYSGEMAVLRVSEAVIYPKDDAQNNVMTAAYSITDKNMDILVPFNWINDNIGQHELVIDPQVSGNLAVANILGSKFNASCTFDSSCNYSLNVNIPAATTVTGINTSFTFSASGICFGSDGAVKFSSGSCSTAIITNSSGTNGNSVIPNIPILGDLQACVPAASCGVVSMPFTLHFYRSCKGLIGCDNSCIGAYAPWFITIKSKWVEFSDLADPIYAPVPNICMGDSIYVNTYASYGVAPYNYNWSFNPTGVPSLGTGFGTSITFPNIINNTIFAIITDACGNTAIDSLPITVNYAAVVATPSSDSICSGETTAINLTSPATGSTFTWTVVQNGVTGASAGSGTSIAQTLTTTTSSQGSVTYTITPQNVGCTGDPITVTIIVNPPIFVTQNLSVCSNQMPYTWNGTTFTTGGTAISTFTTPSLVTGCDSTTTLNLTVKPVLSVTLDLTICAGQLPFTWNGIPLTAGGTAVASFTTNSIAYNCDSTTILNLTVVTTLTATQTVVICANQLPYFWNGVYVMAGGPTAAMNNTISPVSGCDSITTLNLIVHPLPTATVPVTICANQLPYNWNGQPVTSGGPNAATFTTPSLVTGCDSITTLSLTVNPLINAAQNITRCASQMPYTWNNQTITAGGNGVATYTTPSLVTGCDSTTTLNLTVNPLLSVVKNQTICATQLPYTWNGISVAAGGNAAATFTTPSMVTGCDSTTMLNLTVNPVLTSTTNTTICSSQLPYIWNGISVTAGGTAAATFTTPSLVTNCDSIATLNLTVNPVLAATVNRSICISQLPYTWNGITVTAGGNAVATFTTPSLITNCDSVVTLNLTVNPLITATVTHTICANQLPYTWNGQTITGAGTAVATYNTMSLITGCDSLTTLNLIVNPLINHIQTITICNSQLPYTWNGQTLTSGGIGVAAFTTPSLVTGCDSVTTLYLNVNPVISVVKNITICASQLPYVWNNQTITAGGTAVATYIVPSLVSNCDSITTLNLMVNPLLTSVQNITICVSQLPYTWNGQTITAGGAAVSTFTTGSLVTTCDSTVTLNLTVNPVLTGIKNITICSNQLPYIWNGITVNTGGNNAATFTSPSLVTGCDSTTTLNLTVNPVLTATVQTTICPSQLPYTWNSIVVNTGGSNAATYTTPSLVTGCDSTTTLNLTVNPVLTATVNRTICISQLPYTWNGQTIAAGGMAVATFTTPSTATGCDSITTLNLIVNPLINTTKTISICINQLPYTWNGQTLTAGGSAVATYTTASLVTGCDSTTTLNLIVNPLITAIKNQTICANQLPYTWNGQTITTGGTAVATFTTPSLVTGCDSTTTLNLTVNPLLTATQNITICTAQLPYTWNGQTIGVGGTGVASFTTPSLVTGCDSTTTLNLTTLLTLTGTEHITICATQLPYTWNGVTVTAGGPTAATFASNIGGVCDSITTLNLTVNPTVYHTIDTNICYAQIPIVWNGQSYSTSGNYTNTYTSAVGCDSIVTLSLHITVPPVVLPLKDSSDCGQVYFNGNTYTSNILVNDTLYGVLGCDSAYRSTNILVYYAYADTLHAEICAYQNYDWEGQAYNQTGVYTKHYTSAAGCDSALSLALTVWQVDQVSITYDLDEVPCMDDTITVAGHGSVTYLWKLNGADMGTGEENKMPLSSKNNQIVVNATDEHNCESAAYVNIETVACCDLMIPNAFSPNGDGLNDKFGPESIGNPMEFKMTIFNRFGQLVFTSVTINNKWDGTYLGKPVDVGTYFYRIFNKCTNESENTFKGDITVIR
jgi:gliding motility-associated-like protein